MRKVGRGIVVAALVCGIASVSSGHENPPGCTIGATHFDFTPSSDLQIIHRVGDRLDLGVVVSNNQFGACTLDQATVTIRVPAPDGTPGPVTTVITGASFPGGMPPTVLPRTVPYSVAFDPAVFFGPVTIAHSGTGHYPGGDAPSAGGLATNIYVSKPHATLTVTPSAPSGPSPFAVTYTYTVTNDTPVDPNPGQPTPAVEAPTLDTAIVTDDTCAPLVFTGGDTSVTQPPWLQVGETWTFTCTRVFTDAGTFTNHASVVGGSSRDFRPWPATTSESTVTAIGPDLTVAKTHTDGFAAGESGAYAITVTNSGNAPTTGTVTVADALPGGLTATAVQGDGWSCDLATTSCTRSDALAAGASYAPVTVTVDVALDAPPEVTNVATVAGGAETTPGNDSAADPTSIIPSNRFDLGTATNDPDGAVSVPITVFGAGELAADDVPAAMVKAKKKPADLVEPATTTSSGAGTVTLRLQPTRMLKRKLARKRTHKAPVMITFTPTGGTAASQTQTYRFKRAKKR